MQWFGNQLFTWNSVQKAQLTDEVVAQAEEDIKAEKIDGW